MVIIKGLLIGIAVIFLLSVFIVLAIVLVELIKGLTKAIKDKGK